VSVNGKRYDYFLDYTGNPVTDLRSLAGQTVELEILRTDGRIDKVPVTLRPREMLDADTGALGITGTQEDPFRITLYGPYTGHDPVTSASIGVQETGKWFGLIIEGLGGVVRSFVTNPTAPPAGVTGPVGIAQQIGLVFFDQGPILTLYVAGILSANLALVNALPFPPLDGGRMLMLALKRLFGKRISIRAERLTYFVGFVFLMAFLVWVTWFDIIRGGAT
jgi:membrane-associated protease RseP (regulator of RpoE activity)